MNPWHDVKAGNIPKRFNVVVEIPKGSKNKYEIDEETGLLFLDRTLYSPVYYPGDYGFIPRTWWYDDDPLDVLVLSTHPVYPLTVVQARPVGIIKMIDNKQRDYKILAVPLGDPNFKEVKKLHDLHDHTLEEIKHFFNIYKELQKIKCKVVRFGDKKEAENTIKKAAELYKKKFD